MENRVNSARKSTLPRHNGIQSSGMAAGTPILTSIPMIDSTARSEIEIAVRFPKVMPGLHPQIARIDGGHNDCITGFWNVRTI